MIILVCQTNLGMENEVRMIELANGWFSIFEHHNKSNDILLQEAQRGITPSMFGCSVALFKSNRIEEGFLWYSAGLIRAYQDTCCCLDKTVSTTFKRIKAQMQRYIPQDVSAGLRKNKFKEAVLLIEKQMKELPLPSPDWISAHGLMRIGQSLLGKSNESYLVPEEQWKSIRFEVIRNYKEQLQLMDIKA